MKSLWLLSSVATLLAVCGCTSPKAISPDRLYVPPRASDAHATIRGTHAIGISGVYKAYVQEVDGKKIAEAKANATAPVRVVPGKHLVRIAFSGLDVSYDEHVHLESEKGYEVRAKASTNPFTGERKCELWVVDAKSGERVTDVRGFGADGVPFPVFVPIPTK